MTEPLRPEDITPFDRIPAEIVESTNELLKEHYRHVTKTAKITLEELKSRSFDKGIIREVAEKHNWFDIEPIFQESGWDVEYCKSQYGDGTSFPSYFLFKPTT
jgi:hypothetical protein